MSVSRFDPEDLSMVPAFAGLSMDELGAVIAKAEPRELRRGEILVRQGEASDELYFVVSGRFAVETATGATVEIGQGRPIGEVGFFADVPRTATVRALRDSQVLAITRARFREIGEQLPHLRDAMIGALASQLADATRAGRTTAPPRTIAIVLAGDTPPAPKFVNLLRRVAHARSHAVFLTRQAVGERFADTPLEDPAIAAWLNALEVDSDILFYVADPTLTDWTATCIRQADLLLLVAAAGAGRALNPAERLGCSVHPPASRRLVLVHDARRASVAGTAGWLADRDPFMHHHVALQDAADVERLFRFLAGRAVGFVAGGGGAFGSAHLGVYKALAEIGADFDIFGGTSVGAAMTAALAAGLAAERVDAGTHTIFVKQRAFQRYALPYYGLLDHKVFDRALRAEYGTTAIEDLWKPFFAVSTNLSRNEIMVHRRGPVWEAVRASGSIPALLPPFFTRNGEMLVDGGIIDNVPLAPMRRLKSGPNVVVSLSSQAPTTYPVEYDAIPGLRETLIASLNPFRRRKRLPVPGILQVVMRSMAVNRPHTLALADTDLLIEPALPYGVTPTRWERHTEVFMHAYHAAAATLRRQIAADDPRLAAILGAGQSV
jgi:NTE family protein